MAQPESLPVEKAGGTQNEGPWPDTVDEVVEGNQYDREVLGHRVKTVTVERTQEDPDGARAVTYTFTPDGGSG